MRLLYNCLIYFVMPFALFRLYWRSRKLPDYRRRISERFGCFAAPIRPEGIWIHAVSVGEVQAAVPLIKALLGAKPEQPITVTTMTPTGSAQLKRAIGDQIFHVFCPYDMPDSIGRFLKRIQPQLLIIMETELWPNMLSQCAKRHIPVLLANARLSAKSAKGYARFGSFTRGMMQNLTAIAAQNAADGQRYIELGLAPDKLYVSGNLKFDFELPTDLMNQAKQLRQSFSPRPVWIAASTHAGEEEIVLAAFAELREQFPDLLLLLVPRHPDRFNTVADQVMKQWHMARRSKNEIVCDQIAVYLGDTMGELLLLYAAADVCFVGGSLIPVGGHNFIEPAAVNIPIVSGEHVFNFKQLAGDLAAAKGILFCQNASSLARQVALLLSDKLTRQQMVENAHKVIARDKGALDKHLALIEKMLSLPPVESVDVVDR